MKSTGHVERLQPSFRRSNSGSLAKFAAMRRALAVDIYGHQHLEADPGFEPRLRDHARPLRMHSAIGPQGL